MTTWTEAALSRTWRALADEENSEWRLMTLHSHPSVTLLAGRSHPGNQQAVVVVFPREARGRRDRLPLGEGFDIVEPVLPEAFASGQAVALVRRPSGSEDMFATLAVDTLRTIDKVAEQPSHAIFKSFIERVKDWQDFMSNKRLKPLSPDMQVGLMGELIVLEHLAGCLERFDLALSAWLGPLRAAQDFHINGAAIEVKSSVSRKGFPATINSIDQLDSDMVPLFLAALRFNVAETGSSLVEVVGRLRLAAEEANVSRQFEALLFSSRYFDEHEQGYGRLLDLEEGRCWQVDDHFPRLARTDLANAIFAAKYKMNLDAVDIPSIAMRDMLTLIGAVSNES